MRKISLAGSWVWRRSAGHHAPARKVKRSNAAPGATGNTTDLTMVIWQSSPCKLLEPGQRRVPEIVDELADAGESLHANGVEVARAFLAHLHQPRFFEHAQMPRHRRPADR